MRKIILTILKPILPIFITACSIYVFYNVGYIKGRSKGINMALDTVNKICAEQVNSDTTISELILVDRDTIVYFISKKSIVK